MKNYECIICGEPLSNPYHDLCPKCYHDEYFDKCQCGNSKRMNFELCKDCQQLENEKQKKELYGYELCPFCREEFIFSSFLHTAISNDKTRLIANLITHYRHSHQSSWNKSCLYITSHYGETAYERAKTEHNNRAKRQILRKCKEWLVEKGVTKDNFLELQENDEKTLEMIEKSFKNP